jgi:hypothetical protein
VIWVEALRVALKWSKLTGERYSVKGYRHGGGWRYALYSTGRQVW